MLKMHFCHLDGEIDPLLPPFEAIERGNECGRTFFHPRCIEKPTMAHLDEARQS